MKMASRSIDLISKKKKQIARALHVQHTFSLKTNLYVEHPFCLSLPLFCTTATLFCETKTSDFIRLFCFQSLALALALLSK